ncbi:MAG: hypothetical protein OEW04_09460 [Nitrospirota bacterium]|nr:hypothetical protein [Nitrospirota bacterium]
MLAITSCNAKATPRACNPEYDREAAKTVAEERGKNEEANSIAEKRDILSGIIPDIPVLYISGEVSFEKANGKNNAKQQDK